MIAKISYTLDFNDIPKEVGNLLYPILKLLNNLPLKDSYITKENIPEILEQIQLTRKNLVTADNRLNDCYEILSSYYKTLTEQYDKIIAEQQSDADNKEQ